MPWLQQHIGKQSAKIETSVTRGTFGATFIDCGVPEGYINQRIRQLSEAARAVRDGNIIHGQRLRYSVDSGKVEVLGKDDGPKTAPASTAATLPAAGVAALAGPSGPGGSR